MSLDPRSMAGRIKPRDAKELRQAVEWALNDGVTLDVRGQGSKLALGKPMRRDQVLDLSGLSGVVDYAPEELVVTLRAGTPLSEVEALLAQRNQMLAFEPPDLGPLLGLEAGQGTLVGAGVGNPAGSRRVSAGGGGGPPPGRPRREGRGGGLQSGGAGGENGARRAPDQTRTLLLLGLADDAAVKAMCAALGSPHDVSGAAHVDGRTALRIEGVAPSVEARLKGLRELLATSGAKLEELGTLESRTFWPEVPHLAPLNLSPHATLRTLSCPPTAGSSIVSRIR